MGVGPIPPNDAYSAAESNSRYASRLSLSGKYSRIDYTSAIAAVTSTTWVDLDTATDITLTGVTAGDVIEVGLAFTASDASPILFLDCVSWVSGAAVNSWGTPASGISDTRWGVQSWVAGVADVGLGGVVARAVASGDLASGSLTLRLRARLNGAGSSAVRSGGNSPFTFWAKNCG